MNAPSNDTRTVTIEREFPYPPQKLWRALTQPHLISEWLMNTDFKPELGNRFFLKGDWGGVSCQVLEIEPEKTLSYSWNHDHEDPVYALESVVTFTLTQTGKGTHLRMEQVGFRPEQKLAFGGAKHGWKLHFDNLGKVVSRLD